MYCLCIFLFFWVALAYERINIFSDLSCISEFEWDTPNDLIHISSLDMYDISYKSFTSVHLPLPEGLEFVDIVLTDPEHNRGSFMYETPFDGLHITLTYDRQRPLTGLCDIFSTLLPCFNVKQCAPNRFLSFFLFILREWIGLRYRPGWCDLDP